MFLDLELCSVSATYKYVCSYAILWALHSPLTFTNDLLLLLLPLQLVFLSQYVQRALLFNWLCRSVVQWLGRNFDVVQTDYNLLAPRWAWRFPCVSAQHGKKMSALPEAVEWKMYHLQVLYLRSWCYCVPVEEVTALQCSVAWARWMFRVHKHQLYPNSMWMFSPNLFLRGRG